MNKILTTLVLVGAFLTQGKMAHAADNLKLDLWMTRAMIANPPNGMAYCCCTITTRTSASEMCAWAPVGEGSPYSSCESINGQTLIGPNDEDMGTMGSCHSPF